MPRSLEEEREPERAGEVRADSVSCCDKPFRPSSSMRFLFSTSLALRSFSYSISSNASSLYDRNLFIPIPPKQSQTRKLHTTKPTKPHSSYASTSVHQHSPNTSFQVPTSVIRKIMGERFGNVIENESRNSVEFGSSFTQLASP